MSWEERMSQRARDREPLPFHGPFLPYGTVGELIPDTVERCRACYEDRWIWCGNMWAFRHVGTGDCDHECHADEVWLAS